MTMWDYLDGDDWRFNHSDEGVSEGDSPVVLFPSQKWWNSKTWRKRIVPTDRDARIARVPDNGGSGS